MTLRIDPRRILMIVGHSAGIGDLLRASASWRALKNRFPEAELHLALLTKEPGYPSERLISKHHLLTSFHSIDKRIKGLKDWRRLASDFMKIIEKVKPDLIIDFEPHGLKSSFLCLLARLKYRIPSLGVGEIPLRSLFYTFSSPPTRKVLRSEDYTDRFFVVLSALGIERDGIPIEIEEPLESVRFRESFRKVFDIPENVPLIGLNIGCGTPDALWRRPDIELLRKLVSKIQEEMSAFLILTGADFERDVNEEFLKRYNLPAVDLAGKTDILELPGLIKSFSLFVTTDSGPYHISVALRVPTLGVFVKDFPSSYHNHPWVRNLVLQEEADIDRALELIKELRNEV